MALVKVHPRQKAIYEAYWWRRKAADYRMKAAAQISKERQSHLLKEAINWDFIANHWTRRANELSGYPI